MVDARSVNVKNTTTATTTTRTNQKQCSTYLDGIVIIYNKSAIATFSNIGATSLEQHVVMVCIITGKEWYILVKIWDTLLFR